MTTGQKLRRAIERRFRGATQRQVAARLGVPPASLSEWLSGHYEPTLPSLREVAARLECSVAALVGDEGPSQHGPSTVPARARRV